MFFDEGDEVSRRIAGQGRLAEMRVLGNEVVGAGVQVGEVAAPAARDRDLLTNALGVFEHDHFATTFAGGNRAKESGGATANHDDIGFSHGRQRITSGSL